MGGGRGAGIMAQINNAILNEQTLPTTQLQQISGEKKEEHHIKLHKQTKELSMKNVFYY